jgi:integral membrane protein
MNKANPIPFLRIIGMIEAVSFLLLLGVAMPLKYFAGMPGAVKVVGWIHGVLFVIFSAALLRTLIVARWPIARAALIFVAALLPFGPFVVDKRMRGYEEEFEARSSAR